MLHFLSVPNNGFSLKIFPSLALSVVHKMGFLFADPSAERNAVSLTTTIGFQACASSGLVPCCLCLFTSLPLKSGGCRWFFCFSSFSSETGDWSCVPPDILFMSLKHLATTVNLWNRLVFLLLTLTLPQVTQRSFMKGR